MNLHFSLNVFVLAENTENPFQFQISVYLKTHENMQKKFYHYIYNDKYIYCGKIVI